MDYHSLTGLDFETYSSVDLNKYGMRKYMESPHFRVLLAGVSPWLNNGIALDFVKDPSAAVTLAEHLASTQHIVAHNAAFEQAVLKKLGIEIPSDRFVDTAMLARACGVGGSLAQAAPQLLDTPKDSAGEALIQLFSVPSKQQRNTGNLEFDEKLLLRYPTEWDRFGEYAMSDAQQGLLLLDRIHSEYLVNHVLERELCYSSITMDMCNTGWTVDLDLVRAMQDRYTKNLRKLEESFRAQTGAHDLNLNSLKQLKEWCADRGIRATSFDKLHVESLIRRIEKRLDSAPSNSKAPGYAQVLDMLKTKQALGGTGLKKLQVILDTVSEDGQLRDQYFHIGAAQSWRTTGRSVQLQNIKQLGNEIANVKDLFDPWLRDEWDNEKLGDNLRQVFTSRHPRGVLMVGDFASIESRGLAYLAGDGDKVQKFAAGLDMYKVQAAEMFSIDYADVTDQQRKPGKVGELSCGYGAGPSAVKSFAEKMHINLSEDEATEVVTTWRAANPKIVTLWEQLDTALRGAIQTRSFARVPRGNGLVISFEVAKTPASILALSGVTPVSIAMYVRSSNSTIAVRFFHGCHIVGNDIHYYKPSKLKGGPLWSKTHTNPKTKQVEPNKLYGGKLAGILTQSFCREIFFSSLASVKKDLARSHLIELVGQFHDEIVLDYQAPVRSHDGIRAVLGEFRHCMETPEILNQLPGFPLVAEVKYAHRYTK